MCVCHLRFGCINRFSGLAVAALVLVRSMRLHAFPTVLAIATTLVSCDEDHSYIWADKPHSVSPSGWAVAYVQEAKEPSPAGWSAVLLDLRGSDRRSQCCATAIEFHQTSLPLKMQWLDPTTLEVRYPKDASPIWPCDDVSEHDVGCVGRNVRVVLVRI
jgi:hypothetical protein